MPPRYQTLGRERVKREWIEADCLRLERWFNQQGEWVGEFPMTDTRSRLWYCLDLLAHGDPKYQALANQVILKTGIDENHFEPFAAVELLLRFPDKLTPKAAAWLRRICAEHYLNSLEVRCGGPGTNNFTCMSTWFLLAAAQVLDGYRWDHPLASIPQVYTRERMQAIGRNALAALCYWGEHQVVLDEWNSPTYTPICAFCMAKIWELVDDPRARQMALGFELNVWRQILALYHPQLGVSCGPYGRAYRQDMLGFATQMRVMLCYVGISKDRSILRMLEEAQLPQVPPDPDAAFRYAGFAWEVANKYHVPLDALEELKHRQYPHRAAAPIRWDSFGYIDPQQHKYVSVQGHALPAGEAEIVQVQQPTWSLGWRTLSTLGHSFPMHLQYGLRSPVKSLRDLRSVTMGVAFHNTPQEWQTNWRGVRVECPNFNNEGRVEVREERGGLAFTARPFPELAGLPSAELSVNSFLPEHFATVEQVTLDGERYTGQALTRHARQAVLRVRDAGMEYTIAYSFPRAVEIRLYRWGHFLRFAGFWYRGKKRFFTPEELSQFSARGRLTVVKSGERAETTEGEREC